MGISLTEQGYSSLDYDVLQALKYITKIENDKMEENMNQNNNNQGMQFQGGFNR